MNSWLLLLGLFSFALAENCATPKGTTCDPDVLKCCDTNLQTAVGADCKKQSYDQPDCLEAVFESTYFNGTMGAYKFCDAYNDFRTCLFPTTRTCTSTEYFVESGRVPQLAAFDEGLYARLNFMCGAGLDTFLRNYDDHFDVKFQDIRKCYQEFNIRVHHKPADACEYLNNFALCFQYLFSEVPELSWFMCENARTYGSPLAPHCDVSCTSTS